VIITVIKIINTEGEIKMASALVVDKKTIDEKVKSHNSKVEFKCLFCGDPVYIPKKHASIVDSGRLSRPLVGEGYCISPCAGPYCSLEHYIMYTED
jgi:hypothetical protein